MEFATFQAGIISALADGETLIVPMEKNGEEIHLKIKVVATKVSWYDNEDGEEDYLEERANWSTLGSDPEFRIRARKALNRLEKKREKERELLGQIADGLSKVWR